MSHSKLDEYSLSKILHTKPFTAIAIVLALICTYYEWNWFWGALFIYWAVPSIRAGEAFLVERVSRRTHPVYFWAITAMWAGFGVWMLYADLAWRLS